MNGAKVSTRHILLPPSELPSRPRAAGAPSRCGRTPVAASTQGESIQHHRSPRDPNDRFFRPAAGTGLLGSASYYIPGHRFRHQFPQGHRAGGRAYKPQPGGDSPGAAREKRPWLGSRRVAIAMATAEVQAQLRGHDCGKMSCHVHGTQHFHNETRHSASKGSHPELLIGILDSHAL